ncbi:MAG TPA: CpsB/CapC family capsule biosynthesis tyrosine phosphatase [Bacillota bacterium]|nr:CpsB/CapC family capsule biosynthesis tyrosine phosphatase [Bacillota bacterium]
MFDLHCHILHGLDDGAVDLDTALQMLIMARKHGATAIVATPHVMEGNPPLRWAEILAGCEQLQNAAADLGLDIRIYPGAEVAVSMELLKEFIAPGPYCINGGKYMLVEPPLMEIPDFVDDFLFRLQSRGIIPIVAHPERHPVLARNPEILLDWIRRGVLTQITGASLTGKMGEQAQRMAKLFLLNRMVHVIGSDAHGIKFRRPKLDEAAVWIRELMGEEMVKKILFENPQFITRGDKLNVPEVDRIVYPKKLFR